MNSKNTWIILVVIAIITILALSGIFLAFAIVDNADDSDISSFTVLATAQRDVVPDEAQATFTVSETGTDANTLNDNLDKKAASVSEYLDSEGIEHTINKNSYDRSFWDNTNGDTLQMQANITATFEDIQDDPFKVNTVLREVVNRGADTFYGFQFTISNRDQICEDLETEALQKLKDKAELQKEILDISRTVSTNISTGVSNCNNSFGFPYAFDAAVESEGDLGRAVDIEISGQEQMLSVEYGMEIRYRENSSRGPLNLFE